MPQPTPEKYPGVTIVIVTRNRCRDLIRCLDSIHAQTYPNLETIVIDNAGRDATRRVILERYPWVRLYRAETNLGTAVSRNAAVKLASGPYVWFLDSDTVLLNTGYIYEAVGYFNSDSDLGAIGGEALLDRDDRVVGVKRLKLHPNGVSYAAYFLPEADNGIYTTDLLATCNMIVPGKVLHDVGGFDPWYFFFMEDLDLSIRIRNAGYALKVHGKVPVQHCFSPIDRNRNPWMPHRNRLYFALKHFKPAKIFLLPLLDLAFCFHPNNMRRVRAHAEKIPLGNQRLFRVVSSGAAPARWGHLLGSLLKAAGVVLWMWSGYFFVVPHFIAALKARRKPADHLSDADLSLVRRHSPGTRQDGPL